MGGEHDLFPIPDYLQYGSSPRGRGTLEAGALCRFHPRIIPAWAGNTLGRLELATIVADHPRVGGEHSTMADIPGVRAGSSPRGRGTLFL